MLIANEVDSKVVSGVCQMMGVIYFKSNENMNNVSHMYHVIWSENKFLVMIGGKLAPILCKGQGHPVLDRILNVGHELK